MEHQIAQLQRAIVEREERIARLDVEAEGAAQAVQNAQVETATATQLAQQRAERIAQLEQQLRQAPNRQYSPAENVLNKLKTPNILRDLPCFDGNPVKLHQFLRAIDNIMPIIDEAINTPMHSVWMQCIRSKVIGDADTILELYGTELSWQEIKTNLINHYNDKRDEVSLTRDLFKLTQITTVEEFYGKVSHLIALLINQLCLTEINYDVVNSKKKFYQEIGLKVFLAGLKEPLGPIVRAQSPENLKEALRLCAEENNYTYVRNPFKTHAPPIPPPKPQSHPAQFKFPQFNPNPFPRPPIRSFPTNFQQQPKPFSRFPNHNPFRPSMNTNPFRNQHNAFKPQPHPNSFNTYKQSFPNQNAQLPKPVPMEVDPSIRSRAMNYMNRPHFHLEHDPYVDNQYSQYENNTAYNDSEYYYTEQQPYYESPTQTENVETPEPTVKTADSEAQVVDDLNFHIVSNLADTT